MKEPYVNFDLTCSSYAAAHASLGIHNSCLNTTYTAKAGDVPRITNLQRLDPSSSPMGYQRIVASLLATLGSYSVYKLLKFFYSNLTSPLRVLPGPPNASIIYGNLKQIWDAVESIIDIIVYFLTYIFLSGWLRPS